jgi:hypothetical protein
MGNTYVMDGKNYVEVERKARVGDKVLIVNANKSYGKYDNGSVVRVDRVSSIGIESNSARTVEDSNSEGFIHKREYVVLEPLESEETPSVTDLLANLARRASSLEQQLSATQANTEKLAEELANVKYICEIDLDQRTQPKEVEAVTFEKFLDSIADKVAERLVGR